jgi:hypothetical protein
MIDFTLLILPFFFFGGRCGCGGQDILIVDDFSILGDFYFDFFLDI